MCCSMRAMRSRRPARSSAPKRSSGEYDLVLADGRLPDGSGMALADRANARGIPSLIVTGYAFDLMKEDLGRFDFLLKPVRPDELLQAVERVLARQQT